MDRNLPGRLALGAALIITCLLPARLHAGSLPFALGVNYTGAQLRWNPGRTWAAELRYQTGTSSSSGGDVHAQAYGLRGYYFYPLKGGRYDFFLGGELAILQAQQSGASYNASGFALGAFGGFERSFGRRLALGLGAGPYLVNMGSDRGHGQRAAETSVELVADAYLLVRLF